MGRWCSGDIEHKFWFGIQPSDASWLGGDREIAVAKEISDDEEVEDTLVRPDEMKEEDWKNAYAEEYVFTHSNMLVGELKERIERLNKILKAKSLEEVSLNTDIDRLENIPYDDFPEKELLLMAEVSLGLKIYQCVEGQGYCAFTAEF